MMDKDKRKLLKDSLEIIKKYSNREDKESISLLLSKFDSNELDESTLNQLVHQYYSPTIDNKGEDIKKSKKRNVR